MAERKDEKIWMGGDAPPMGANEPSPADAATVAPLPPVPDVVPNPKNLAERRPHATGVLHPTNRGRHPFNSGTAFRPEPSSAASLTHRTSHVLPVSYQFP